MSAEKQENSVNTLMRRAIRETDIEELYTIVSQLLQLSAWDKVVIVKSRIRQLERERERQYAVTA